MNAFAGRALSAGSRGPRQIKPSTRRQQLRLYRSDGISLAVQIQPSGCQTLGVGACRTQGVRVRGSRAQGVRGTTGPEWGTPQVRAGRGRAWRKACLRLRRTDCAVRGWGWSQAGCSWKDALGRARVGPHPLRWQSDPALRTLRVHSQYKTPESATSAFVSFSL